MKTSGLLSALGIGLLALTPLTARPVYATWVDDGATFYPASSTDNYTNGVNTGQGTTSIRSEIDASPTVYYGFANQTDVFIQQFTWVGAGMPGSPLTVTGSGILDCNVALSAGVGGGASSQVGFPGGNSTASLSSAGYALKTPGGGVAIPVGSLTVGFYWTLYTDAYASGSAGDNFAIYANASYDFSLP